jgi:hypothetical protein
MSGAIPPLPQYVFIAWCSVTEQGQLYLLPLSSIIGGSVLHPQLDSAPCRGDRDPHNVDSLIL